MSGKIGIGIAGCGNRIFGLLEMILPLSDRIEIKGLYDPSDKSVKRYHDRFGKKIPVYETSADLSNAKDIDWVMMPCPHLWGGHAYRYIEAYMPTKRGHGTQNKL